jgi:hypothetical protein
MYDRNGLQLSTAQSETLNSYYKTAVDLTIKKYAAVAYATRRHNNEWAMFTIGDYDDPRDAAYVAQEFFKVYSKESVRTLQTDGEFSQVAREFRETIEIPEWQFPAEGLLIEDILNESANGYKQNYVADARTALLEAINVFKLQTPNLKTAKTLINKVEEAYKTGLSYREAARNIMNVKG